MTDSAEKKTPLYEWDLEVRKLDHYGRSVVARTPAKVLASSKAEVTTKVRTMFNATYDDFRKFWSHTWTLNSVQEVQRTEATMPRTEKGRPLGAASGGSPGFWDWLGVNGESGLPTHLPMGVNIAGQGPEADVDAHHYVCSCGDVECPLTLALGHAWTAGLRFAKRVLPPEKVAREMAEASVYDTLMDTNREFPVDTLDLAKDIVRELVEQRLIRTERRPEDDPRT